MNEPTNAARREPADWPFAAAAFLGSSLVFVVQPVIAKQLLPTLGGAPAVWTTCVLFFQFVLLVGYAWAHLGPRWLGERRHAIAHVALLLVACAFLPLGISRDWRPSEAAGPIANVLGVLARSVGLPLCVLAATSPLIQRWHVALRPGRGDRVYRLYAIGNVASLLVLLAYPLAIEPTMTVRAQLIAWSVGFVALAILLAMLARSFVGQAFLPVSGEAGPGTVRDRQECLSYEGEEDKKTSWRTVLAWVVLSAVPSSLLLGVTTFLTSDVASVPFLWVLPLTVYLGAFSLAFAGSAPVPFVRHAVAPGLAMTGLLIVGAIDTGIPAYAVVALRTGTFFLLTWACLAALYERRPSSGAGLTAFYLWIAVGGVVGGAFNSLVAPVAFDTTAEYPLATVAAAAIAFAVPRRPRREADGPTDANVIAGRATLLLALAAATLYAISESRVELALSSPQLAALILVPIALCAFPRVFPIASCIGSGLVAGSVALLSFGGPAPSESHRSFFGVHRIVTPRPEFPTDEPLVSLMHGTTTHGIQSYDVARRAPARPDLPLAYYHRGGPLGEVFAAMQPARVGVVGLGAGTIAAYLGAGQHLTYFEIDPLVIRIADGRPFTFLPAARQRGVTVEIVEGDARLTLDRPGGRPFDLLVLDAFSGDAIPAHLLTREAFATYARRLAPAGTLAVHISNRYLDLSRVVAANAPIVGGTGVIGDEATWQVLSKPDGATGSTWVVLTRDPAVAAALAEPRWQPLPATTARDAWTDDFSNLLHTLK